MAGVVLSGSSEVPVESKGAGPGDGGVGASGWEDWSLYVLVWLGLSMMVIGSVQSRVRHVHATLMVGARRWTLQCGASEVRS